MKKKLLFISMSLLTVSLASACGNSNPYKNRAESFTFSYCKSGYGEWGKALANYYMDNVNENVYIDTSIFENSESVRTQIQNKAPGLSDLYQIEVDLSNGQNFLCELTDIYNSPSVDDNSKTIKDLIDDTQLKAYNEKAKNAEGVYEDHYYRMPETMGTGWHWIYNKTTLDNVLGENSYTLPRTTDEFFSLSERILTSKKAYPVVFCGNGGISGEYVRYVNEAMFAQMTGYQGYDDFFSGYYYEGNTKKFALTSPEFINTNRYAIEKTYEFVYKLFDTNNYYVHPESDSFNYKQVNQAIYNGKLSGYGSKLDQPPVFAVTGSWIENEIKEEVSYGFIDPSSQEIYAMKLPVMSAITARTPTINSDTTLRQVVDYVDGKGTLPEGVSAEDAAIIKEARSFVPELICRDFAIPKTTKKEGIVKDFLKWLTSVEAQKVVSKFTKGANILPYGYQPTDEDLGFEISPLLKSFYETSKDSIILDESGLNMPFRRNVNFNWLNTEKSTCANFPLNIFNGYASKPLSQGGPDNVTWFYNYLYGKDGATYISNMKTFKNLFPDYVDDWGTL